MADTFALKSPLASSRDVSRAGEGLAKVDSKTKTNVLLLFALMVPFIEPQIFKLPAFEMIDNIFAAGKLVASFFIAVLYIRHRKSTVTTLMLLCQIWILVATISNGGSLTRYAGPAITSVDMFMVGEMAIALDGLYFCRVIRTYLSALFAANLVTCMAITVGFDLPAPLFGIDNRWIYVLLPWVALSFIVDAATKGRPGVYAWTVLALSVASLVALWSVGAMLALLLWPIAWYLHGKKILANMRLNTATSLFVVFAVAHVLLIGGYLLPYFGDFMRDILHKDVTLAGRVYLWKAVMDVLGHNPLFGAGVQTGNYDLAFFFAHSGNVIGTFVNHPHNYLLNVAYHGGYVAAFLFAAIHLIVCRRIDVMAEGGVARCMYCFIACYLFASLVDTLDFSLMYLMLSLAWLGGTKASEGRRVQCEKDRTGVLEVDVVGVSMKHDPNVRANR